MSVRKRTDLMGIPAERAPRAGARPSKTDAAGPLALGRTQASSRDELAAWGLMPALAAVSALALLVIAAGNYLARAGAPGAELLFWLGIVLIIAPFAARLASERPSRQERLRLAVWLGMALYVVKVMNSPNGFTYADEFMHWHNVNQILSTQTLFGQNLVLPISALYPGLPSVTASLVSLGGLSVFWAGILVIAAARLVMILALFWLAEQLSQSPRVAGLTVLIYAANPNFLFFDAQFSYESLALPLVVLVLAVAHYRLNPKTRQPVVLTLVAFVIIGAVVITHHLSSYFMVAVLLAWTLLVARFHLVVINGARTTLRWYAGEITGSAAWRWALQATRNFVHRREQTRVNHESSRDPSGLMFFALILTLIWLAFVASSTVGYVGTVLGRAVVSVFRLIAAEETGRTLFVSTSGYVAPVWEHIIGLGSIVIIVVALPFGLVAVWRRYRRNALVLVLALMAIAYLGMLGLRFAPAAWETSNRASEFLYIGLAFVLALGVTDIRLRKAASWIGPAAVTIGLTWVFCGGIVAGWPENLRLARVDQVAVGDRILQPQETTAAVWMLANIGPGHVVAADDSNGRVLLTQAHEDALVGRNYSIDDLLSAPSLDHYELYTIQRFQLEYILVDQRRISSDNMRGYFFVPTRPVAGWDVGLYDLDRLAKFESAAIDRIFDSGDIAIYNLETLRSGQPAN